MLAAASMSGCRRDNPAWLRATDVGTDTIAGTESDSGAGTGATGTNMSGSDSEGEVPFEERVCQFTFSWDTNLTEFFPGLGVNCGIPETYFVRRTVDDELQLFDDPGCLGGNVQTSGFHQILIGSLSTDTCYEAIHDTELVAGKCETAFAIITDPAAPADPPVLVFSRRAETPMPLEGSGFSVAEGRTQVCTNCNDSNENSGLYSPSCCSGEVERFELEFTVDDQVLALVPGPLGDKTVTIGGKSRQLRVLAAERVSGAECSPETTMLDKFALENIAWVVD